MAELLGDDYGDNPSKHSLGRDHGLVEFFWQRASGREPWAGTHFSVQAHRLRYADPDWSTGMIRDRYGAFPGPVTFDEVSALLADRGVPLAEVPYPADPDEMRTYWQPASQTLVSVVAGTYYGQAGDLYRVRARAPGSRDPALGKDRGRVLAASSSSGCWPSSAAARCRSTRTRCSAVAAPSRPGSPRSRGGRRRSRRRWCSASPNRAPGAAVLENTSALAAYRIPVTVRLARRRGAAAHARAADRRRGTGPVTLGPVVWLAPGGLGGFTPVTATAVPGGVRYRSANCRALTSRGAAVLHRDAAGRITGGEQLPRRACRARGARRSCRPPLPPGSEVYPYCDLRPE